MIQSHTIISIHANKIALVSLFPHAMLANKVIQLLIGNRRIRICNNLSEKHRSLKLMDHFCLTATRLE